MAKQKKINHLHVRMPFIIGLLVALGIAGSIIGYYVGYDHGAERDMKQFKNHMPQRYGSNKYKGCDGLKIVSPTKDQQITSPVTVTVIVDNTNNQCKWTVFEAQAGTMTLKDSSGQTLGTGTLTTSYDWMTDQPVEYTGTITFSQPTGNKLKLLIEEENPSGQPGASQVTLPLTY